MKILENTGIKLYHPEILKIVKEKGIKVWGDTVYFSRGQIMEWVSKAPKNFKIYARNPQYDMSIGGDNVEYCSGYGCTSIIEKDGNVRQASLNDYIKFLKIIHQSKYFNINGGIPIQPTDLKENESYLLMVYATILYSDKCIMGIPGKEKEIKDIMEILSILFGGREKFIEKPRSITLISTTSPLQIDKVASDTMMTCINYNQPIIVTPGPISGSTGPITLAGNIALGNAETLVGIALSQMIKEGTPVVYGMLPTTTDMRTGYVSIGSPGFAIQSKYSSRLAKMYGLPNRSGGAVTDAKGLSVQSGYESMLSMFACHQEKSNLIIHSAGIMDGFGAMSYEQFMVDLEIISMLNYYFQDIEADDESLAVDIINEVGPGGQFLSHEHTFFRCRTEPWVSTIGVRSILKGETANERIFKNITKNVEYMLNAYEKPFLDHKIKKELINYLESKGIEKEKIEKIG